MSSREKIEQARTTYYTYIQKVSHDIFGIAYHRSNGVDANFVSISNERLGPKITQFPFCATFGEGG